MRAKLVGDEIKGIGMTLIKQMKIKPDQNVKTSIEPCAEPSKIEENSRPKET